MSKEELMKKSLVAGALIAAFATTPALAEFYVAADLSSGNCMIMSNKPNRGQFKILGTYKSRSAAHKAEDSMKDCQGDSDGDEQSGDEVCQVQDVCN
jgi:hypothetical protein